MTDVNTIGESVCPLCGGTGWRDVASRQRTRGHSLRVPAQGPRGALCWRRRRFLRATSTAIWARSKYDPEDPEDAKTRARLASLPGDFVEDYPVEKTGLLLVGSVGVGKTHLAVGILKALIRDKGVPCLFCDYRELLKSIQNSFNASVQATEMEILRPVFDAEVLVIDELGAVRSTEWVFDTVNYILNSRYNDNKTTIFTTNFPDKPEQERRTTAIRSARPPRKRRRGARLWATASASACAHVCTRCARRSRWTAAITGCTRRKHTSSRLRRRRGLRSRARRRTSHYSRAFDPAGAARKYWGGHSPVTANA